MVEVPPAPRMQDRSGPAPRALANTQGRSRERSPARFEDIWPAIDCIPGFLMPGQERWLFNAVMTLPEDATIVEIGAFLGRSTTAMAMACCGTRRCILAIDTFEGNDTDFVKGQNNVNWVGDSFLDTFKANLASNGLLVHVTPIQGRSHDIGRSWDKPIDFLFIDGSHDYEDVIGDFNLFFPWVKPGGVVALHDVLPEWPGPFRAWWEHVRGRLEQPVQFFSIGAGLKSARVAGRVHVVIPVHNRVAQTRDCLKTLHNQTCADHLRIHVVDDGSTDGTRAMLDCEFPKVNVIFGNGKLWWTGAVARALDTIRSDFAPGDFFLLVNNDVRLCPETVEVLVQDSLGASRICLAPTAVSRGQAISAGWGPGLASILNNFEAQYRRMTESRHMIEVAAIFGRCSLFPVEILDYVNNYDAETFPHYWGDTDFCLRAAKKGYRFAISGRTTISVIETEETTGLQHWFRGGPKSLKQVWYYMFSIKSIDNIVHTWRYMSRHHPKRKYRQITLAFLRIMKQWTPLYFTWALARRLFISSSEG